MAKTFNYYTIIFSCSFFLQGCIVWVPLDVDYDVEIVLDRGRPKLGSDIGFISYGKNDGRMFGCELYGEDFWAGSNDVFLLSRELKELADRTGRYYDCDVEYPRAEGIKSFHGVDLTAFTNSVRRLFDKKYRIKREKTSCGWLTFAYGGDGNDNGPGFGLASSSFFALAELPVDVQNMMSEHSLEALLLRRRFPKVPALHEYTREGPEKLMPYNNPHWLPLTKIVSKSGSECFEMRTDGGLLAGSLTIHYPRYMYIINSYDGRYEARQTAMKQFLTMYRDDSKSGKFTGVVTAYMHPFWMQSSTQNCYRTSCKITQ